MIINVAKQSISISSPEALVSNSVGQYMARISFSDEWKDFDKIVVFRSGETSIEQAVDAQSEIIVPWEVLQKKGTLEVGAYGLKGTEKRPTIWSKPLVILQGVEEGETAHEPTILPWEEIVRRIGQLADLDTENKSSLVGAINEVLSTVPAFLSELTPDAEHMTVSQAEKNAWNGKADPEDIPHNVSDLNNDAGYITEEDIPEVPVSSVNGKTGAVVLSAEDVHALPENTPIPEITASAINNALGYTAADNADVQENAQEISQINESITEIQTNKAGKSEIPDVSSFVKDTDYATTTKGGTIKSGNGLWVASHGGVLALTRTKEQYPTTAEEYFVSKGTLDNVLAAPSIMPTLTESEQAAARQRIGLDKEWTLKGTITTENKSDGVIVDLTGCTELVIRGTILCIAATSGIAFFYAGALISASDGIPISDNTRYAYMRYADAFDGIEPIVARYRTADALPSLINGALNCYVIPAKRIKDITRIRPIFPNNVDACSLEIYAR